MGCATQINNTQVACRKNNVFDMIREVKTFQNKLNENNMESLECFLVSTKSIPIFFGIIQENINKTDELYNIKIDYNPEKNVKIYYGFEECKSILEENNNEINEFIIVGDRFFELMKIDKGEKVTIVKDNELKIIFKGEKDKITLVFKSNISYKFKELEHITIIEENKAGYINQKDSFMLNCLIKGLINIDLFKDIFLSNEQVIKNDYNKYETSNTFLKIIKNGYQNSQNELIHLNQIIVKENMLKKSKYLIHPLITYLFKESNNSNLYNSISNIFVMSDIIHYICNNCKYEIIKEKRYNLISCLEYNLESVRNLKSKRESYFIDINIIDCFYQETFKRIKILEKCPKCGCINNFSSLYKIINFPDILIIILDRNNQIDERERIEFRIDFKLDLSDLSFKENKITYDLVGILSYKKDIEHNVFYNTVFCKNSDNWVFYDINKTKTIDNMSADIIHTPYMLFYLKNGIK